MGLNITNETDIKDEKYYETMSGLVLDFLKGIYKDEKFSVEFKGDKEYEQDNNIKESKQES